MIVNCRRVTPLSPSGNVESGIVQLIACGGGPSSSTIVIVAVGLPVKTVPEGSLRVTVNVSSGSSAAAPAMPSGMPISVWPAEALALTSSAS